MKGVLSVFLLVACFISAKGQADTLHRKNAFRYFNTFHSGALIGKTGYGTTASFQTVHGLRFQRMAMGLGIGYDDYNRSATDNNFGFQTSVHWKAVPVFASFSVDFWKMGSSDVFLQMNAGYTIVRADAVQDWFRPTDISGGEMINPSLGYRINSGRHRLYIGAGYKWQVNRYKYTSNWTWGFPPSETSVKETMQRVVLQIGFGWH